MKLFNWKDLLQKVEYSFPNKSGFNKKLIIVLFCFFIIFSQSNIKSQELETDDYENLTDYDVGNYNDNSLIEDDSENELTGLIIDETISKIGRDFSEYFFTNWQRPAKQLEYTILIQEKPLPSNGSQILIYVDDYLVFQNFVQPRIDVIEEYANYGIYMVNTYLENYEMIQQQLQGDDLSGTGIY